MKRIEPPETSYLAAAGVGAACAVVAAVAVLFTVISLGVTPTAGATGSALSVSVAAYIAGFVAIRRLLARLGAKAVVRQADCLHLVRTLVAVMAGSLVFSLLIEGVTNGAVATADGTARGAFDATAYLQLAFTLGFLGHLCMVGLAQIPALREELEPGEGQSLGGRRAPH